MSTNNIPDDNPDDVPDDATDSPDASAQGAALDKRPSAAVATRPDTRLDRPTRARGPQLLHARLRRPRPDGRSTRSRVREVLRWLVRNSLLYLLTGVWVLTRRWWEARTNARYERQMRAAEAAGDQDRLTDWEARAERAREQRHRRRMDWITAPIELARSAAVLVLWLVGALLGLGAVLAVAHADFSWVLAPLATVVAVVAWLVWLANTVWRPLLIALAVLGVVGVWQIGRASGVLPAWAAPANGRVDATVVITPGGIAAALAHLGIPALNRAVKDGWQVEFSTPPVRVNRRGYQAVFSLPMGVTPEMIADTGGGPGTIPRAGRCRSRGERCTLAGSGALASNSRVSASVRSSNAARAAGKYSRNVLRSRSVCRVRSQISVLCARVTTLTASARSESPATTRNWWESVRTMSASR